MGDGRESSPGVVTRSLLHEEAPRDPTERLRPLRGDLEALTDLEPPVLLPDGGDEVETHAVPEDGLVAWTKAHGPFPPVRGVREPDRVADSALLAQPVPRDRSSPGRLDVLARRADTRGRQGGRNALDDGVLGIEEYPRGLTQVDRTGQRTVVPPMAAGELEERALALPERSVVPREVRRGGLRARRQHRHDRRVVTAVAVHAVDARPVDLGHQRALRHARLDELQNAGVHRLDNAGGSAHELDLARRFDGPLPVHERGGVHELSGGKVADERSVAGGSEVVVVQLYPDTKPRPSPLADDPRE